MNQLQRITLEEMRQILLTHSESSASNYVSQNLVVVRNPPFRTFFNRYSQGPILLPEMRIMMLTKGWTKPTVNLIPRRVEAGQLIFLGTNGILEMGDIADEMEGLAISMSGDLFTLAVGQNIPPAFDGHLRDFIVPLTTREMEYFDMLHDMLYRNTREKENSAQVSIHLISAMLWYVDSLWKRHETVERKNQTREQQFFTNFITLVNRYAPQEHNIDFYASRLFLSPRYMSTMVRAVSGKPAKQWIDEAIITRVKIELRHSDKQVAQISDEMGFPNTSFFCKYFKRMTGITPMQYRKKM